MVDSHCHLADEAFVEDIDEVVARARSAGIAEALCIVDACEPEEAERARGVRELWPAVRTATGVHPHRAATFAGRAADAVDAVRLRLAADDGVRAVGEIGLDYHYDFAPPVAQQEVFGAQVELARDSGLPVVIHTREADRDTLAILRGAGKGRVTGVFHCFSGDVELAREALDLGFLVSFSGIVTFPRAGAVRDALRFVPDDRLLVETDCPYLAPVPRRGKRNEPAWVTHVGQCVAELRGTAIARLVDQVVENYRRLFTP